MTTTIDRLTTAAQESGHHLGKAIPRSDHHLLVELTGPAGQAAGQWFTDPARARHVYTRTREAAGEQVQLVGEHLVLQPGGADRRLPALRDLLQLPQTTLMAHRPEQRAVVRHRDEHGTTRYIKTVRPTRLDRTLEGLRLRLPGITTAAPVQVDPEAAAVTMSEVPGRTLFDLLGDPGRPTSALAGDARRLGAMLHRLHRTTPGARLPVHDVAAELAVLDRWQHLALTHGAAQQLRRRTAALRRWAAAQLAAPAEPAALVHRDLHDKQLMVSTTGTGILDLDLASRGEPALDLANLLVHLDLRAKQHRCTPARAHAVAQGLLEGYGPLPEAHRIAGYAATTAIRLAHVYAFRPDSAEAAERLLTTPDEPLTDLLEDLLT